MGSHQQIQIAIRAFQCDYNCAYQNFRKNLKNGCDERQRCCQQLRRANLMLSGRYLKELDHRIHIFLMILIVNSSKPNSPYPSFSQTNNFDIDLSFARSNIEKARKLLHLSQMFFFSKIKIIDLPYPGIVSLYQ